MHPSETIPNINIDALVVTPLGSSPSPEALRVVQEIHDACTTWGFFQISGHHVPVSLQTRLLEATNKFFTLPEAQRLALHVKNGGVGWRGYMPLGGEGTHGRVDHKEGMYFGPEHPSDHRHTGLPLHGKNQFPDDSIPEMREVVLQYIDEITRVGKILCDAISLSLGLDRPFIRDNFLEPEPVALFRCFKYAGRSLNDDGKGNVWGIGEHTDFGLLTILKQDSPGLQVLSPRHDWVDVPVLENHFVCNVGDMLDMLTGGRYKSVPHRVIPPAPGATRISFPFFFDFSWTAKMTRFPLTHLPPLSAEEEAEAQRRWQATTFKDVSGEWWQYLAKKVKKVFPELALPDFDHNVAPSSRFTIAVST